MSLVLAFGAAGCKKKDGDKGANPATMSVDQACDKVVAMMGDMVEKMGPMMAGAAKCAENPKVKAAMSSME